MLEDNSPPQPRERRRSIQWAEGTEENHMAAPASSQQGQQNATGHSVGGLAHFAQGCPGLTGRNSRSLIEPWTFERLLTLDADEAAKLANHNLQQEGSLDTAQVSAQQQHIPARIVVPLFQRKYCWTSKLGKQWFNDALAGRSGSNDAFSQKHGVGKIVFKPTAEGFICVDGQQRVTTTTLLLAAIRDAVVDITKDVMLNPNASSVILHLLTEEDEGGTPTKSVHHDLGCSPDVVRRGIRIIRRIHECLFTNPVQLIKLLLDEQGEGSETSNRNESFSARPSVINYFRLVPSLDDRRPLIRCLMDGVEQASNHSQNVSPAARRGRSQDVFSSMKATFDECVINHICTIQDPEAKLTRLEEMITCALTHMYFMFIGVLGEVDLCHVFLWLQEKSLFGFSALLHNPTPGMTFHAVDLIRNLALAPFMAHRTRTQQEEVHVVMWARAIEDRCHGDPSEMDEVIDAFLTTKGFGSGPVPAVWKPKKKSEGNNGEESDEEQQEMLTGASDDVELKGHHHDDVEMSPAITSYIGKFSGRHISHFERTAHTLIDTFATARVLKNPVDGMLLYARFFSFYEKFQEAREQQQQQQTSPIGKAQQQGSGSGLAAHVPSPLQTTPSEDFNEAADRRAMSWYTGPATLFERCAMDLLHELGDFAAKFAMHR